MPNARSGWEVVDFYEDAGISGSNVDVAEAVSAAQQRRPPEKFPAG